MTAPADIPRDIRSWPLERVGRWVYETVIVFGGLPETAHLVAGEFVAGVRRERSGVDKGSAQW